MNDVINRIIEIEEKARRITDEGRSYREGLSDRIKAAQEELALDIEEKTSLRLEKIRAQELHDEEGEVSLVKAKGEAAVKKLEKNFSENREKWLDELWQKVIEVKAT